MPTTPLATRARVGASPSTSAVVVEPTVRYVEPEPDPPAMVVTTTPPPPQLSPPQAAGVVPAATWAPPAMMPPTFYPTPQRGRGSRSGGTASGTRIARRLVIGAVVVFAALAAIGALENAGSNSSSDTTPISVPSIQISIPTFGDTHGSTRHPARSVDPNVTSDLVTLSAAEEIYQVEYGRYTADAPLLARQIHVDLRGNYQIGLDGSRSYCLIGQQASGVWRLYDKNHPETILTSYADAASARRACSLPVRWGG
ncbi:MAG TPA: hypothetical protein VG708_14425 [Mycobacteriales bacterium]|nr:hypothetical protein [Mycobacteriales bacterium]